MFEGHDLIIHDLVAARGLVAAPALDLAKAEPATGGRSLATRLVESGLIEPAALFRAVADQLGCSSLDHPPNTLPAEVLTQIDGAIARDYGVVPLSADGPVLSLLVTDPFQPHLVADLAFVLGREVRLVVTDPALVQALIRRHYGEADVSPDAAGEQPASSYAGAALTETDIGRLAGQTPIIRFVNRVLAGAIRDGASDVHFEPFEHEFKIRCRIDGELSELPPPSPALALPVISRLKVLANLDIAERRLPQDGRIRLTLGGRAVDLRVSTLPTQFGESLVLRVLDQSAIRLELGQLGLPAAIRAGLEAVLSRPNGILLVTGPTSSGKSTTLYSCLQALNTTGAKLLTVEDPVEHEIDGVMQVPVNLSAGLTFARALRTFLRQDPDVVMVGEIRDPETAQIAIQASLTGHLVLSTLHTNDAPGAVTRLVDMGIEPFLLASTVEAVLAQRLVRRICSSCRTAVEPTDALLKQLDVERAGLNCRPFYSGRGCTECAQTGFKGRLGIFEFLRMSEPLRELVVQGASLLQLRQQAVGEGMTTLRQAGIQAVLAGETTVEEALKYT
jgi:type IV pilus assembly protein PilB